MATTKIWAIKDSVSRVLSYAANPEKTIYTDLKKVLHYADDESKTEQGCYVTGMNCNAETAFDEMNSVQQRFGKISGNVAYHAYQSFKTGEVTPEICHKIGVELARKMWGGEHQVLVATHFNTGTYHNHFVVNSVNMWTGKKFNCNKGAYYKFRELSDSLCFEYGLSLIRNPSGKTPRSIYFAEKNGEPTTFNVMREAIDFAIEHCRGFPDFKYLMREQGYAVNVNSTRKYWTIQSVNSQKSVRMYRLGDDYTNESIVRRIKEMGNLGWRNFAEYEHHKRKLKTFKPKTIVFRGSFKCTKKFTGLYAKYLHYLYLLGNSVQLEMKRRADKYSGKPTHNTYPFTGLITCDNCGKHYRRKVTPTGAVWICSTYNTYGKSKCPSKAIPETTLTALSTEIGGIDKITAITAKNGNILEFTLTSGETITKQWQDRSRAESWTLEMRAAVGKKNKERRAQNANS